MILFLAIFEARPCARRILCDQQKELQKTDAMPRYFNVPLTPALGVFSPVGLGELLHLLFAVLPTMPEPQQWRIENTSASQNAGVIVSSPHVATKPNVLICED